MLKRALKQAERARDYAQSIVETVPISLVVLDGSLRIVSANPPFYGSFAMRPNMSEHAELFELAAGALNVPATPLPRRPPIRCPRCQAGMLRATQFIDAVQSPSLLSTESAEALASVRYSKA